MFKIHLRDIIFYLDYTGGATHMLYHKHTCGLTTDPYKKEYLVPHLPTWYSIAWHGRLTGLVWLEE